MPDGRRDYTSLYRRLLRTMLATCLVPLLLVGGATLVQFRHYARQMVLDQQERVVVHHGVSIDAFLQRLRSELRAIADRYTLQELISGELERVLGVLQQGSGVYTDLGLIDDRGNHLKYVGPYNLKDRNYRETAWFSQLRTRDLVVSDLFLGYRGVPHFIIAVKRRTVGGYWILRASLSSDNISRLVEAIRVGATGEAFLLDREGLYQTRTRLAGRLLEPSGFPMTGVHAGVHSGELSTGGLMYVYSDVWTAGGQWMLVFRQQSTEAFAPITLALWTAIAITAIALAGAVVAALSLSRRLVRYVQAADTKAEELHAQLTASSRMAAVGEMATGIAHEINNPLGNIETLRTWILDLVSGREPSTQDVHEVTAAAGRIGEQVERCRRITHDLLRFSRPSNAEQVSTNLGGLVEEMVAMAAHRVRPENVRIECHCDPLPQLRLSPAKIEQVVLNLLNNAVDAMEGHGGTVTVTVRRVDDRVRIEVADSGCGIAPQHLPRIFEPFFTTKPVGKGTGLGLAVCFGLVQQMRGSLDVDSRLGVGSTFALTLPLEQADVDDAAGQSARPASEPEMAGTLNPRE